MKTLVHTEREQMEELIRQCNICHIGMADTDGTPYVLPMNFGYQDGIVYLHSAPEGRSVSILERNPRVCITFCLVDKLAWQDQQVACSYTMKSKSVMVYGNVEFVEEMEQKREILTIFMKNYSDREFTFNDPAVRNVKIWKVPVELMTCKEFGVPHRR